MKKKLHYGEMAIIKFSQDELREMLCEEIFGSPCEYGKLLNRPTDILTSIRFKKNQKGEYEMLAVFSVGDIVWEKMDKFMEELCLNETDGFSKKPTYINKKL